MYNSQVTATQLEILNPVMNAEVLVLDDLGAIRPSDWVWDTVSLMINNRYNGMRTTIITTNYPVLASGEGGLRAETLSDRIGERMRSRLIEMCKVSRCKARITACKRDANNKTGAPDRKGKGSDSSARRNTSEVLRILNVVLP
jgi:DNA replication protein DnaC